MDKHPSGALIPVVMMEADNVRAARSVTLRLRTRRVAAALVAGISLFVVGCGSSGAASPDHGVVIGHLRIPFMPKTATGTADVVTVTVPAGQRFSVEIDTSDGPYWWTQTGAGPDSRIVKVVGNYDVGSCPANQVGCRVPYYHTLLARARGVTTMTWRYDAAPCRAPATSPAHKQCPSVTEVQFDIRIR